MQGCKLWARNRVIRQAYNARARVLAKEIEAMRKAGKPSGEIAKKANEFRHKERMLGREQMRKNGDGDLVKKLEARDLKKVWQQGRSESSTKPGARPGAATEETRA